MRRINLTAGAIAILLAAIPETSGECQPEEWGGDAADLGEYIAEFMGDKEYFDPAITVPIYRLKSLDRSSLRRLAVATAESVFRLFSETFEGEVELLERDDYFFVKGPDDLRLRIYVPSGFVYFERERRMYDGQPIEITETEAVRIARQFIDDNRLVTVGSGERLFFEKTRRVESIGVSRDGEHTPVLTHNVVVIFGRMIGGLKVVGPGSRVVIFIGENKEVVGFQKKWREFTGDPVKEVAPLPVSSIARTFADRFAERFDGAPISAADLEIKMYDYGLFSGDRHYAQGYFQPVCTIGFRISTESTSSAFAFTVPAYDEPVEPIGARPEEPAANIDAGGREE